MTDPGRAAVPLIGFKRHLRPEIVEGDAVYLFSERGVTALEGDCIEAVAPLLDGTRDFDTLLREVTVPQISREQLSGIIDRLIDAGLVVSRLRTEPRGEEPASTYWEASGVDPDHAMAATATPVRLVTTGRVEYAAAASSLASTGLTITDGEVECGLTIVMCDDYLCPDLVEIDAAARRDGRPWLLARPTGERVWIGPIFDPAAEGNRSPCWHCLAFRLWGHRPAEAHVQSALGRRRPVARPTATVPALATAAVNLIALEAAKWLAGNRYTGQRCVWTLDSHDLRGQHHEVQWRPQCRACGDPVLMRAQAQKPVELTNRPKRSRTSGGHRALRPDQVLDRYRHLISPVSGVVKEIRRDPRDPGAMNAFLSGPNAAPNADCAESLRQALRMQNGGKGITPQDAEASALCEALERHCAVFQGDEEMLTTSMRMIADQAIHPDRCQLFHVEQFRDRERWNAAQSALQYVCEPFDDNAVMDWTPVWSITEQRHRLLPTNLLYFGAPRHPGPFSVRSDSNGNAAGSSLEDAVLQGLLEVVERDAVALWWYNRTSQPAIELDAFAEPWIDDLRQMYVELNREIWVLDLTADLELPVMVALSRRVDKPSEDIIFGFGAQRDPRIAVRRALTEMNQLMTAVASAGVHGGYQHGDEHAVRWWQEATLENQPYLVPQGARKRPQDYAYVPFDDLFEDVDSIHQKVREKGLELLVLDQTRPDIGLPVVKVIVPGMRHFWARYAPGRLYDVPVQLGRLDKPTLYENLNPVPLFV